MKAGWYRIEGSSDFQYRSEEIEEGQGEKRRLVFSDSVTFLAGPMSAPRSRIFRLGVLLVGWLILTVGVLGLSFVVSLDSTEIEGIARLISLGVIIHLSTKTGYRWFDGFLSLVPFFGAYYIGRTLWRASCLPHRYWTERESKGTPKLVTQSMQQEPINVEGESAERLRRPLENLAIQQRRKTAFLALVGLIISLLSFVTFHQSQVKSFIDDVERSEGELLYYNSQLASDRPTKNNLTGATCVFGECYLFADTAWDMWVKNTVSPTSRYVLDEVVLNKYKLTRSEPFIFFANLRESHENYLSHLDAWEKELKRVTVCETYECFRSTNTPEIGTSWKIFSMTFPKITLPVDWRDSDERIERIIDDGSN
jgi:hypothetical protein